MLKPILFLGVIFCNVLFSQESESICQCEPQEKSDVVPLPDIRQADVMWSTTLWREIDMRQKINQTYYYPLEDSQGYTSLFNLMVSEIKNGCMKAYKASAISTEGEFSSQLTCNQMEGLLNRGDSIQTYDLKSEQDIWEPNPDPIMSKEITRFRIKEQWIFDKQHSRMTARTIGIAPMVEVKGEDGTFRGYKVLFWVHYPESRRVLARHPVFVRHNDNKSLNYDDLFAKRYYDGFIVKESNVQDRYIREYAQGIDILLEGEDVEKKIRDMESDMWAY